MSRGTVAPNTNSSNVRNVNESLVSPPYQSEAVEEEGSLMSSGWGLGTGTGEQQVVEPLPKPTAAMTQRPQLWCCRCGGHRIS